ncbi:NCS1 nucleoside transporter family protein [Coccidioides posadasii C735 delta SOWgp]|nr:NCS1 nucleoside transporter family protein [Coccidioides posadasii C735 delta SOWgp]EER25466.1 NCS1 nucleoside transporter family protein [Coccidioides posadasii C735 delta SOWgp]|eukprot:XP_003067611.1 NCS1 nucleoside transporter family protein [Coccidioides posadasii C735 delta SOWgp]
MAAAFLKKLEVEHEGGTLPDRWINNDIKPIESERRTWSSWTFTNYWILVNSNISTYMTGSSLIALGLSWWQAIIAIVIGNLLATAFVVLNSLPGAYYNIGFPVVNRYVWGLYGSQFVIWNRILLSIVWFGFQAYVGGQCVHVCLTAIWPSLEQRIPNHMAESTGITSAQFLSYVIFMVLSVPVVWIRPHKLRTFFHVSSSVILVFEFVLLIWALATMGPAGFGSTITAESSVPKGEMGWTIAFGIISTIGGISAGILNQNDYARFARRPRHAIIGQLFSFPLCAIVCSIIGVLVTAATQNRFGEPYWNLPELFLAIIESGGSRSRAAAFFAGFALIISQMGVNVPGNALSGGFDLAATFPKYINIRRGAYLTLLLSVACNPWKLVSTATVFLSVLSSYAVFLGPMTGLMISSWFVVNQRKIKIEDLYIGHKSSIYWCTMGVDWRALIAWLCGTVPSLPGFVAGVNENVTVPSGLVHFYQICFLAGFGISAAVYCGLHFIFPVRPIQDFVASAPAPDVLMREYREACDNGTQFKNEVINVDPMKIG